MKKIKLLGLLFVLSAFFNSNADAMLVDDVLSHVRDDSTVALSTLQVAGLDNVAAVQDFKKEVQGLISELSVAEKKGDPCGQIGMEIGMQKDLLLLVDRLIHYKDTPTDKDASELRSLARSNSPLRELIRDEMNKQSQAKYKFLQ